ncbi:MAG: JAB domain-containing protein [Pseudoxanthomonas suwonensis]|nr:JAB domain-containing protein [Pseudoxanthomonas suwonensis]
MSEQQIALEQLRAEDMADIADGDGQEALTAYQWAQRAREAGVDEFDTVQFTNESVGAYGARMWQLIQEARRGTDRGAAQQDHRTGNQAREGRQEYLPEEGREAGFQLGHEPAPEPAARQEVAPPSAGLFGAPTARDHVDAARRQKDAQRDGKTGTGRTDMLSGDGELFAGSRPEQGDVETGTIREQDVATYGETRPLQIGEERRGAAGASRVASGRGGTPAVSGQLDLFVATRGQAQPGQGKPPAVKIDKSRLAQRVGLIRTGQFRSGVERVKSLADAAHILAPIRKSAQERFAVLAMDKDGRPLAVLQHTIGTIDSSLVEAGVVFGAIASIPGAARIVWAHNHPSGNPEPSAADAHVAANMDAVFDRSGISIDGAIILQPGSRNYTIFDRYRVAQKEAVTPARRQRSVPQVERQLVKVQSAGSRQKLSGIEDARREVTKQASQHEAGLLVLNNNHELIGVIPFDPVGSEKLRTGKVDTSHAQVAAALHGANAAAVIVFGKESAAQGVRNMARAANIAGVRVLDTFLMHGAIPQSEAIRGGGDGKDGLLESASPMKSVDANIRRGREALARALTDKTTVHRAMHRTGMGWVDFVWGDAKKGIEHILRRRQESDGMTEVEAKRFLSDQVVDAIAKGQEIRRSQTAGAVRVQIAHNGAEVSLVRRAGSNTWLLTAFELPGSPGRGATPSGDTGTSPTRSRTGAAGSAATVPRATDTDHSELTGPEREAYERFNAEHEGRQAGERQRAAAAERSQVEGDADADRLGLRDAVNKALGNASITGHFLRDRDGLNGLVVPEAIERHRQRLQSRRQQGGTGALHGLYVPASLSVNGKPFYAVFTGEANTPELAALAAAHEVAGHHGLRTLLGQDLDKALGIALQNPTVKAVAEKIAEQRRMGKGKELLAAEEALAELNAAMRTGDFGMIERRYGVKVPEGMRRESLRQSIANFLKRLRALFAKRGIAFTDEQVRSLLDAAHNATQRSDMTASVSTESGALEQVVFHGTPHTVDRFSLDKIGTGEGAQAYGWGMYFAGRREVADHYRKTLSIAPERLDLLASSYAGLPDASAANQLRQRAQSARMQERNGDAANYEETAKWIEAGRPANFGGNLYRVEVPEDSDLLDYDKPLSQQPDSVRQRLDAAFPWLQDTIADAREDLLAGFFDNDNGSAIYRYLTSHYGSPRATSEALNAAGIPGLRYLDGNSRADGDGSYNYVIWDEAVIGEPESVLESVTPATRQAYEARIDALFDGDTSGRQGVRVLDRADVIDLLGYGDKPLHLVESAVGKQRKDGSTAHPAMTAAQWKKVPDWIENPAAVFVSDTVDGRLTMIAPETIGDKPVMIVLEPNGQIGGLDAHVLVNAYEKDSPNRIPSARWVKEQKLLYLDQKTSPAVAARSGLQLPRDVRQLRGYKNRVATEADLRKYRAERDASTEIATDTDGLLESFVPTPEQESLLRKAGVAADSRSTLQKLKAATIDKVPSKAQLRRHALQYGFDKYLAIKDAVAGVGNIDLENDPYIAARMVNMASTMEAIMRFGAPKMEGGVLRVDRSIPGLLDALKPVHDKLPQFFGWMVARRAQLLMQQGRENLLTQGEIDAGLALRTGNEAAFDQAARSYLRLKNAILDFAEKHGGTIDPVARAAWDHAEYIPFYREGDTGPGTARGLSHQNAGVKRLKGGEQALRDPLANIIQNFTKLMDSGLKNRAMLLAVDQLGAPYFRKMPMRMGQASVPLAQLREHLLQTGVDEATIDAMPKAALNGMRRMLAIEAPTGENVVRVLREGKPEYYEVLDPLLLRSLTAMQDKVDPRWMKPFVWTKNLLTAGATAAANLQDAQGRPNAEALRRVRAALVYRAYGDERLLSALAEDVNPDSRNIINALAQAAPAFAALDADNALTGGVREAVTGAMQLLRDARERGLSLRDFMSQGDMLGRNVDAETVAQFYAENARSAQRMAAGLRAVAEATREEQAHQQSGDMFGGRVPATVGDILSRTDVGARNEQQTATRISEPRTGEGGGGRQQAGRGRADAGDAGAGQAAGFQLGQQPAPEPAARQEVTSAGLFGAPTARDHVDAARRQKDAQRDGKTGTGRTDMLSGDGELFAGRRPEQGDVERGLLESASPMKSVDANVRRGREALARALTDKTTVHRAMHRTGMGWVDFVWGDEGGRIKANGRRPGEKGIEHILEARQRKDGMSEAEVSRLLDNIIHAIASGREIRRDAIANAETVVVSYSGVEAVLTRRDGSNTWLLSGWNTNEPSRANGAGSVAPAATAARPTTAQPRGGEGSERTVSQSPTTETDPSELSTVEREAYERFNAERGGRQAGERQRAAAAERSQIEGDADADRLGLRDAVNKALGNASITGHFLRDRDGLNGLVVPEAIERHRQRLQSRRQQGGTGALHGLYVPASLSVNGKPFYAVFTGEANTPELAALAAAHEVAGHHGLRTLLGQDLDKALGIALQNPTVKAVAEKIAEQRRMGKGKELLAAEEALAELNAAMRTGDFGMIERRYGVKVPEGMRRESLRQSIANFLKRLRALFAKRGIAFTDEQVRSLLDAAHNATQRSDMTASVSTESGALEQVVFHGTPHTVDRFSLDKPEAVLESVVQDGEESIRVPSDTAAWMGYSSATVTADWGHLAERHPEYYGSATEVEAEVRHVLEKPDGWFEHAEGRIAIVRRGRSDAVPSVRIDFRAGPNGLRVASVYRMPWQQVAKKMREFWEKMDSGQSGYALSGSVSPGSLSIAAYLADRGNESKRPTQPSGALTESDGTVAPVEPHARDGAEGLLESTVPEADDFDQPAGAAFNEPDYRAPVVAWAKARFGDHVAPNGRPTWQNFVEWFRDSQVLEWVSSRGVGPPAVVYHGTRADFDSFLPVREGNFEGMWGEEVVERHGIFFAESAEFAASFARQRGEGSPKTIPVYLRVENPLDLTEGFTQEVLSELNLDGEQSYVASLRSPHNVWMELDGESGEALVAAARAAGYDGIVMLEQGDSGDSLVSWVVFDPEQIKSATGNQGNFDPSADGLLESFVPTPEQESLLRKAGVAADSRSTLQKLKAATIDKVPSKAELRTTKAI